MGLGWLKLLICSSWLFESLMKETLLLHELIVNLLIVEVDILLLYYLWRLAEITHHIFMNRSTLEVGHCIRGYILRCIDCLLRKLVVLNFHWTGQEVTTSFLNRALKYIIHWDQLLLWLLFSIKIVSSVIGIRRLLVKGSPVVKLSIILTVCFFLWPNYGVSWMICLILILAIPILLNLSGCLVLIVSIRWVFNLMLLLPLSFPGSTKSLTATSKSSMLAIHDFIGLIL